MSERWRAVAVALVAGGLLAVVAVVAVGRDDDREALPQVPTTDPAGGSSCGFGNDPSAEIAAAVFRDRTGDAQARHGDLAGVRISHDAGEMTMATTVQGLRAMDAVVALLDTDCDGDDDYSLRFWRDGSTVLSQLDQGGLPLTDLAATTVRRGSTFVSRWPLGETARATRFRVRLRVDTEEYASYADEAPDGLPGYWRYGAG